MLLRLQFIACLFIGAAYELLTQWRGLRAALKTKGTVPLEMVKARMESCRACPIFASALNSCGSPLRDPKVGCFCHMPTAASTQHNCWAYAKRLPCGWMPELNSFPYEQRSDES